MAKPDINNYEDLLKEKDRLKANLQAGRNNIKTSFREIKEELNPFSTIKKTAQSALGTSTTNPIIQFGIKRASEFLIGKVLLKKAGWLPRLIVPFIVREVATRLVGVRADRKIADTLKATAEKIRDVDIPDLGGEKEEA